MRSGFSGQILSNLQKRLSPDKFGFCPVHGHPLGDMPVQIIAVPEKQNAKPSEDKKKGNEGKICGRRIGGKKNNRR